MALPVGEQIAQLNDARRFVLGDAQLYPQIVEGILPIIGINARLPIQRWGADFLAGTFASPVVSGKMKETMGIRVLQLLKDWLEQPAADVEVVKSAVQIAASIYEFVFRYIISNSVDFPTWNLMASIKSNIMRRWDTAAPGIRICCIKFAQKIVQVQTQGAFDPRRPDKTDISLTLVPKDHPLIPPLRLEPEASGLLDRILDIFNNPQADPLFVSATVNCLGVLLHTRPSTVNRILTAVLNFNPFSLVKGKLSVKARFEVKSSEKTLRILLLTWLKRNEGAPATGRIRSYIERLERTRMEAFAADAASKKRSLDESNEPVDEAKRRRLDGQAGQQVVPKPLPPGPNSYAQLYTLTNDTALASFGVWQIPQDVVTRATMVILQNLDGQTLDTAVNQVRARYLDLSKLATAAAKDAQKTAAPDGEEDYEPDFDPREDREQLLNKADNKEGTAADISLGRFEFPPPRALAPEEAKEVALAMVDRTFNMMENAEIKPNIKRTQPGINRLAASAFDRDGWITVISRLATRCCSDLVDKIAEIEQEIGTPIGPNTWPAHIRDEIRNLLFEYIMVDFRARLDPAIRWLNEEWYYESMKNWPKDQKYIPFQKNQIKPPTPVYDSLALKLLDSICPFLDARDMKWLIRFLAEIPTLNAAHLDRVKALARDPERVDLTVKSLTYISMYKLPARELCMDVIEDLWRNNRDAKAGAERLLKKYRPGVLPPPPPVAKEEKGEKAATATKAAGMPQGMDGVGEEKPIEGPQTGLPVAAAG